MRELIPVEPEKIYHVCNKGINGENIFKEKRNYFYFLKQYRKYISIIADTYAFSLLPDHFHFIIRIKNCDSVCEIKVNADIPENKVIQFEYTQKYNASKQFSHFFNSYAQSVNKAYQRTGGLFESPFKRELISSEEQLKDLICKVHLNPSFHGISNDYKEYSFSSFRNVIRNNKCFSENINNNFLDTRNIIKLFGGLENFLLFHENEHIYLNKKFLLTEP